MYTEITLLLHKLLLSIPSSIIHSFVHSLIHSFWSIILELLLKRKATAWNLLQVLLVWPPVQWSWMGIFWGVLFVLLSVNSYTISVKCTGRQTVQEVWTSYCCTPTGEKQHCTSNNAQHPLQWFPAELNKWNLAFINTYTDQLFCPEEWTHLYLPWFFTLCFRQCTVSK